MINDPPVTPADAADATGNRVELRRRIDRDELGRIQLARLRQLLGAAPDDQS